MKTLQYFLAFMGMVYLLSSCASNRRETMIKLYNGASEAAITDPSNYEIISFGTKEIANALASTVSNPSVWFGEGIPEPYRYLELLKADERGIFSVPLTPRSIDFMVVLNKEKSLIACYIVYRFRDDRWPGHPREGDLYGRVFCDVTCKDTGIEEERRREYYKKLFDDRRARSIIDVKKEYGVKRCYRVITEDRGTGEKYIAPLYIEGSHPAYMLPSNAEFDDDGKLKKFFNISA